MKKTVKTSGSPVEVVKSLYNSRIVLVEKEGDIEGKIAALSLHQDLEETPELLEFILSEWKEESDWSKKFNWEISAILVCSQPNESFVLKPEEIYSIAIRSNDSIVCSLALNFFDEMEDQTKEMIKLAEKLKEKSAPIFTVA